MLRHFMKQILFVFFMALSTIVVGQQNKKWQASFQLQPELTFHKNQYSYRWKEKFTKQTFNLGFSSSIYYNLTDRIFLEGGIAFISRKVNASAFINQALLPPPYYDSTLILYSTKSLSLRTLQFPLTIGVNIFKTTKANVFIKGTYISNYLLNVKYEVNKYPAFKKNYWQGYSLNIGMGGDYNLSSKYLLTGSLSYSLINKVKRDPYLFSQDERPIAVPHNYLQLSMGVKINLSHY